MTHVPVATLPLERLWNPTFWIVRHKEVEQSQRNPCPPFSMWGFPTEHVSESPILVSSSYYEHTYNPILAKMSGVVTSKIEKVLTWLLTCGVMVPQLAEVQDYLVCYPDIADLLPPVCGIAVQTLGIDTQLSLEVYHDPEIMDEYLALYVRQKDYDERILELIEKIRKEYEVALTNRLGWLLVTTDFRPPR